MIDVPVHLIDGSPDGVLELSDRGLNYGDGVFETMAVAAGKPRYLEYHLERLEHGCQRLHITPPPRHALTSECGQIAAGCKKGVLKVVVTRGRGVRGYRPDGGHTPTRIVSLGPWPQRREGLDKGMRVTVCRTRLGRNAALAGIKHLNRLEQVLASMELNAATADEGLMLDSEDKVIAGTMCNVFAATNGVLRTPDLAYCGVAGVMRRLVLENAAAEGIATEVCDVALENIKSADEVFLTNSLIGIRAVTQLEDSSYPVGPITCRLGDVLGIAT